MSELLEVGAFIFAKAKALWLSREVAGPFACFLTLLLVTPWLRRAGRRDFRGYLRRSFWTDVAYTVLYLGGVYAFFVSGPLNRSLRAVVAGYTPFLELNLLAGLPPLVQFLALFVLMDGVNYWAHRFLHANRWLWGFHSIHHSQEELTALTYFRLHVVDVLTRNLFLFVPSVVLGNPDVHGIPLIWLSAYVTAALEGLAHSDLEWSYGRLGSVLVSPAFHRVHHSAEARHYNRNFGAAFSFWDRLFGTAAPDLARPAAYGNADLGVPESFLRQIGFPFLWLGRQIGLGGARARHAAP